MRKLGAVIEGAKTWLDKKDEIREKLVKIDREIVRLSSEVIHEIHKGRRVDSKCNQLRDLVRDALKEVQNAPDLSKILNDGLQEYAEAMLLREIVEKGEVLTPQELEIPYEPYLLGLCDVVGELRRKVLDSIRKDSLGEAIKYFSIMEEIYTELWKLHYPRNLIPLRPKQDFVRTILERTRGDLTLAIQISKLSRAEEEDIPDLDKVWLQKEE